MKDGVVGGASDGVCDMRPTYWALKSDGSSAAQADGPSLHAYGPAHSA